MIINISLYRGNIEDFNNHTNEILDTFEAKSINDPTIYQHLRKFLEQYNCEKFHEGFIYRQVNWSDNIRSIDFGSWSKFIKITATDNSNQ